MRAIARLGAVNSARGYNNEGISWRSRDCRRDPVGIAPGKGWYVFSRNHGKSRGACTYPIAGQIGSVSTSGARLRDSPNSWAMHTLVRAHARISSSRHPYHVSRPFIRPRYLRYVRIYTAYDIVCHRADDMPVYNMFIM